MQDSFPEVTGSNPVKRQVSHELHIHLCCVNTGKTWEAVIERDDSKLKELVSQFM